MSWIKRLKQATRKELDVRKNLRRAKARAKAKKITTVATKSVSKRLRDSGMSAADVKRLRGKK